MNISLFVREPGKLRYGLVFTIRRDVKKVKKEETMNPPRKTSLSECWCRHKKSLFLPSILIWRTTRKRKPWTLDLYWPKEQAQFFRVFRSNGDKHEASVRASHAREEEWKKKPRKNTCTSMHTKIEKPRKTFWE